MWFRFVRSVEGPTQSRHHGSLLTEQMGCTNQHWFPYLQNGDIDNSYPAFLTDIIHREHFAGDIYPCPSYSFLGLDAIGGTKGELGCCPGC